MPFTRKHIPSPAYATRRPAIAGPMSRDPLKSPEFSAMALPRSARSSTIWMTKDCRAGISKALIMPRQKPSTMTCHTCTTPVMVTAARVKAWTIDSTCTAMRMRLRSNRSIRTPGDGRYQEHGDLPGESGEAQHEARNRSCGTPASWSRYPASRSRQRKRPGRKKRGGSSGIAGP